MPLLKAEADKLETDDFIRGLVEEIIDKEDLYAVTPFLKTAGKAHVYNREAGLGNAQWISPVTGIVPESAADFEEVTAMLRVLSSQVRIDKFLDETESTQNDQTVIQIAAKAKMITREVKRVMVEGDATANPLEFDGMSKLVVPGQVQTVGAGTGAALTMGMMDELVDAVPNGVDALFMREGTIRAYRALLRTTGSGADAISNQVPNFDGRPVLTHNGIPILTNNFMSGTEDQGGVDTCSIYGVRLNESDGFHLLYGGTSSLGLRYEPIGTSHTQDSFIHRITWYLGAALKSTKSLAALRGITNV